MGKALEEIRFEPGFEEGRGSWAVVAAKRKRTVVSELGRG